jgi:hypothetical protein
MLFIQAGKNHAKLRRWRLLRREEVFCGRETVLMTGLLWAERQKGLKSG